MNSRVEPVVRVGYRKNGEENWCCVGLCLTKLYIVLLLLLSMQDILSLTMSRRHRLANRAFDFISNYLTYTYKAVPMRLSCLSISTLNTNQCRNLCRARLRWTLTKELIPMESPPHVVQWANMVTQSIQAPS